jgi:hypothetical protein
VVFLLGQWTCTSITKAYVYVRKHILYSSIAEAKSEKLFATTTYI